MKCLASVRAVAVLRWWLTALSAVLCFVLGMIFGLARLPFFSLIWVTVPMSVWLVTYPPRYIASISVWVDDDTVSVQTGAWWRHYTIVPITAIRTVELIQTPLERQRGCVHLVLRFAGGTAVLPFLSKEDAHRLGDRLQ